MTGDWAVTAAGGRGTEAAVCGLPLHCVLLLRADGAAGPGGGSATCDSGYSALVIARAPGRTEQHSSSSHAGSSPATVIYLVPSTWARGARLASSTTTPAPPLQVSSTAQGSGYRPAKLIT